MNKLIVLFIAVSLVQFSCSSIKKSAVPCPDFSRSRNMICRHAQMQNTHPKQQKRYNSNSTWTYHPRFKNLSKDFGGKNTTASLHSVSLFPISGIQANVSGNYSTLKIVWFQQASRVIWPERIQEPDAVSELSIQQGCDTIVLRNGDVMQARVLEIGHREIRYKKCEESEGTVSVISLSAVFMIKYLNGTRDCFTSEKSTAALQDNTLPDKTHGMANVGFVGSLIGLFIFGIPLGIMAVVFGIISLVSIDRHPKRYKGRGYAIASIIIGAVDIIGTLIILAAIS